MAVGVLFGVALLVLVTVVGNGLAALATANVGRFRHERHQSFIGRDRQ